VNDGPRILFVCTGNAGRSQMAEALFRVRGGGVTVYSAGVEPWSDLHPMARKLMAEQGIDLAGHYPKSVRAFAEQELELVVTIGDRAGAETPEFRTGVRRIHWDIRDPADADGTPESEAVFRETAHQIAGRLAGLEALMKRLPLRRAVARQPVVATILTRPEPFDPELHLPQFAAAGLTAIELTYYWPGQDFEAERPGAISRLRAVAQDLGIRIASLHPPDRGLLHDPSGTVQMDVLKRAADWAAELDAATISTHAGFRMPVGGEERDRALDRLDRSIDELAGYAAGMPVVFCLETLSGTPDCLSNADLIDRVRARSPAAIGVVLDTGHAHIAGDLMTLPERAGRRLQSLHLHDNDGTHDQHRFPGQGTIDWPAFMDRLDRCGYEGPLLLEVESRTTPLAETLNLCRPVFALLDAGSRSRR